MIKLDFSKYTEEFKECYFKYFNAELKDNEIKICLTPQDERKISISKIKKNKSIKTQLNELLKKYENTLFENELLTQIIINLKEILIGAPKFIRYFYYQVKNNPALENKNFLEDLENIFVKYGYDTKIVKGKLAYKLVEILDVDTCPYCNEQFAYTIHKANIRPQLDHFFSKSKYPFFAISLANLIPSCSICNHKKGDDDRDLISPFEIDSSYETFQFTFIPDKDLKAFTSIKFEDIEKGIEKIEFIKSQKENIKVFELNERYQKHKDIVAEIIFKSKTQNNIKYKMDNAVLGLADDYRKDFCNYYPYNEEEFLKRPLSKLVFDIYRELGGL